jgi:hypothetical protein
MLKTFKTASHVLNVANHAKEREKNLPFLKMEQPVSMLRRKQQLQHLRMSIIRDIMETKIAAPFSTIGGIAMTKVASDPQGPSITMSRFQLS